MVSHSKVTQMDRKSSTLRREIRCHGRDGLFFLRIALDPKKGIVVSKKRGRVKLVLSWNRLLARLNSMSTRSNRARRARSIEKVDQKWGTLFLDAREKLGGAHWKKVADYLLAHGFQKHKRRPWKWTEIEACAKRELERRKPKEKS